MKDEANRLPRIGGRLGALAFLLTLTLGSAAQTTLPWGGDTVAATGTGGDAASTDTPAAATQAATLQPAVATTPAARQPAKPAAPPLPAEFDVQMFEAMAQQIVANQRVPGLAMAIVHDGEVLSARGYGITDVSDAEPVDAHTVFRLASLSKGFAGTMAGLLVNDGRLRWDSKLTDYMPEFQLSQPGAASQITVADLLSHRVGLSHNAFDRDLERYVDYRTLTRRLASAPLKCQPGTCYAYQNVAFSLIGDIVFATTGDFYSQEVRSRLLKPLGMNDASLGLEGIESSARWAKPHVRGRGRGGWVSVMPKPTYYEVAPAAGVNASASDMAQWLIAQTGHRPDVIPAPLLATLHQPLVDTPYQTRSSSWRRARLDSAGYALGWRVYDYSGTPLVYHAGAVQGYRGMIALLPEQDLGIVVLWNGESSVPTGLLPTMLDRAVGIRSSATAWLDIDFDQQTWYARQGRNPPGSSSAEATAAPY
ncbi:serine hydrolase domain-containing protein [Novilysobacter arseniciresistens]|uniref:serine hydrolase domain-containing protein n=1 Tax=Novilysobacter arseniciresistens TaxID=1385522 RepID=UPI00068B9B08|nr:serine hydrolase domain-containing protein [Lysobacter arseniciresistens]